MILKQLQQGNLEAWTMVIRHNPRLNQSSVNDVALRAGPFGSQQATVFLSTEQDPLSFLVYESDEAESRFLGRAAARLSFVVPRVWFANDNLESGPTGIVLEDVEPSQPIETWSTADVERLAAQLATLHALYWQPKAADFAWLPFSLTENENQLAGKTGPTKPSFAHHFSRPQPVTSGTAQPPLLPFPVIDRAMVQKTIELWPELLNRRHLQAIQNVMREPKLLLQPLLTLPLTVLHGEPTIDHWRMTMFGNSYLLDWSRVAIGPAVLDLDLFLNSIPPEARPDRAGRLTPWKSAVESILDSYFLTLSETLVEYHGYGVSYSSRYMRRYALPAARCWLLLNRFLPEQIALGESADPNQLRDLWDQFLNAYRLLTTYVKGISRTKINGR